MTTRIEISNVERSLLNVQVGTLLKVGDLPVMRVRAIEPPEVAERDGCTLVMETNG